MQYDLFHVYTVDEHTLRVLRNVARFADAGARSEFALACEAFATIDKPELLLLAALFHDIAKGRGGDHSALGEDEARAFCARLGLAQADIDLVAWLVRWHLLLSVTAQRQDIADPDVVHRFATRMETRERLDHLYLLTIADIAGTNPALWNAWKARLLADLYLAARHMLGAGLGRPAQEDVRAAACRAGARALLIEDGVEPARADACLAAFPLTSFLRDRPQQIAWQARALERERDGAGVVVAVLSRSHRGSEVFICAPDRDGLFAAITATLDRLGLDVVAARLLVAADRRVFDTFEVLDASTLAAIDAAQGARLASELRRVLGARDLSTRIARRGMSRRLRHFQRAPQIEFARIGAATRLALTCSDRPGLLAQIAQAFREAHVRVHDARIATFGERAEDSFLLSDENDAPLTDSAQAALRAIVLRYFGAPTFPGNRTSHAPP